MKFDGELQPDQQAARWDNHVAVYEATFEPLTNAFAARAIDLLRLSAKDRLLDVGAGSGGATMIAAAQGVDVTAIDSSQRMVERIRSRARGAPASHGHVQAEIMDGMALAMPDASFDAAISIFGVILFPNANLGMREIARVLKPGGRVAVVTWTEIERYELSARLMAAIADIRGPQPYPATLPAQLRFRDESAFQRLLAAPGLKVDRVARIEENWRLPSARWIADRIAFAPGMTAMTDALGQDRAPILDCFVRTLERDQGEGEIVLSAIAQVGIATKSRG